MKNFMISGSLLVVLFFGCSQLNATEYEWPAVYSWPVVEKQAEYVVLYFTQGDSCPPCVKEETEVFPKLRKQGWRIGSAKERQHIRVIDIRDNPECAESYKVESTPTFVLVELKKEGVAVENSRRSGFVDDVMLGTWYNDVIKGKKATSVRKSYPLRWKNWTGPDGVTQLVSREEAIRHLLNDGNHRGKFTRLKLEKLTLGELRALHSDDHERRVNWSVLEN